MEHDCWTKNPADEVHSFLMQQWETWCDQKSNVNVCAVNFQSSTGTRQFVYCSVTHKYADGGAAAAIVHTLVECYEARIRSEPHTAPESKVLAVNQQRLQQFLSGRNCPEGAVDAFFFDILNDMYYHDMGHSITAQFTQQICDLLRVVGLRMACSEEIAWLACMTCALFRLMPDEKLLKLMIVHNGRMGDAEGAVACTSQYVVLSIACASERSNTPLADVASRVKYAVTHGRFRRPAPAEQCHAKINLGGEVGTDGNFSQVFRTSRGKKSSWSRAAHILQLRMDSEAGIWIVKDFKFHKLFDAKSFWESTICVASEIADGWFANPVGQ